MEKYSENKVLNYEFLEKIEKELGDSWYILDIDKFEQNYKEFLTAFRNIYPKTQIAYSYKTNYIPNICKIVNKNSGFAEVVSEMEYDLAIKIGVLPEKIIVNGPYKPLKTLEKYLLNGSIVNLDSYAEINSLLFLIRKYPDKVFNIGLRCNFEFSGLSVSRFGFDVENPRFFDLINKLSEIKNINFISLHVHYPNRDINLFEEKVEKTINIYKKISIKKLPTIINLGGGLGGKVDDFIKKQLTYEMADYQDYARVIAKKFKTEFANSSQKPILVLEPGTALVVNTMQFVSKVIEIKKIRNKFIAITSGSKINFHPLSSQLNLPIKVYHKKENQKNFYRSIDISGYTCIENDYLYRNYTGELQIGDYIVIDNVGSYSIVFKPPFIRPNVPIISLNNGEIKIHKRAEKFDDIFQTYRI